MYQTRTAGRITFGAVTLAACWALAALPGRVVAHPGEPHGGEPGPAGVPARSAPLACPVRDLRIDDKEKAPHLTVNDRRVYFCCPSCPDALRKEPARYLKSIEDPVTGAWFKLKPETFRTEHAGSLFLFKNAQSKAKFDQDPEKWLRILRRS